MGSPLHLSTLTTQVYQKALSKGALTFTTTETFHIVENSIQFLVRILTGAEEKKKASQQVGNPFLPYDPNLYVLDLTETHVCLLNKFCVVPLHILLVTKYFEPQNTLLTEKDFEAASVVLSEWDGVCFYNSSKVAGASQQHKHLQFIPFAESNNNQSIGRDSVVPFDHLLTSCLDQKVDAFPFVHLVVGLQDFLDWSDTSDIHTKSRYMARTYYSLLNQLSSQLQHFPDEYSSIGVHSEPEKNPFSYNLIFTRKWMYVVPRSVEEWQGIAVNALGMWVLWSC
ncbi:Diadenosine 5',5'''-P1,P4-tetraphosphate phosphorylase 2 [Galdieria sulphuraria]|nr:Diadenosine 5',5'''-P1,P4-tetraphosphate phosphorylase 2 [Galdieria sulphuraria]